MAAKHSSRIDARVGTSSRAAAVCLEGRVRLSGAGMVTPVGVSAAQTATSVQSGISRMTEAGDLHRCRPQSAADEPEPAVVARLGFVESEPYRERGPAAWLAAMASLAIADLERDGAWDRRSVSSTGLFLGLPLPHEGFDFSATEALMTELHNGAALDLFAHEQVHFGGHAGPVALAMDACTALIEGRIRYALVGGADSLIFPDRLDALDESYRLKSERNLDGFRPGEAAGFVLLELDKAEPAPATIQLLGLRSCAGAGGQREAGSLTALLRALLASTRGDPVLVCDLNGETARAREWSLVVSRLGTELRDPIVLEHPAISTGDIGAASVPVMLHLAARLLAGGYRERRSALVVAGSDDGVRAGAVLCCGEPAGTR